MAGGDYRSCDVCGGKTFYDANLSYGDESDWADYMPYRVAGNEQYSDPDALQKYGTRLPYVGDWAVICDDCAKTHKTQIVPIANAV